MKTLLGIGLLASLLLPGSVTAQSTFDGTAKRDVPMLNMCSAHHHCVCQTDGQEHHRGNR